MRFATCNCPVGMRFHALNCPTSPGEEQRLPAWMKLSPFESPALESVEKGLWPDREIPARPAEHNTGGKP